jgi:hypothetical protein
VSLDDLVMSDLTVPSGESHIQAPDLRRRQLFQWRHVREVHPLATLARDIDPNPSLLRFAAVVHPTDDHVRCHDLRPLLEAK